MSRSGSRPSHNDTNPAAEGTFYPCSTSTVGFVLALRHRAPSVSNRGPNRSYRVGPSGYVEGPMDSTTLGLPAFQPRVVAYPAAD